MIYFALTTEGDLQYLGDCGDFGSAEESAEDLQINPIWIFDENVALSWRDFLIKESKYIEG